MFTVFTLLSLSYFLYRESTGFFRVTVLRMKRKGTIRYPKIVSIRLEPDLLEELEAWADDEDRPMGSLVRVIIRDALDAKRAKKGKKKPT